MERKEVEKQKEVKILKCVKCGKEYIFDSASQNCPECGGALKKNTAVIELDEDGLFTLDTGLGDNSAYHRNLVQSKVGTKVV